MEADRRRTPDKELRRDIRRVTSILGETLARAEGDDLLALVEQVRAHAKEGRLDAAARLRPGHDHPAGAGVHGVLPPRQHHRAGPPRPRPDPGQLRRGRLARARGRPDRTRPSVDPDEVAQLLRQVAVRPVFTAHPTEVARRSTIDKLRRVAALLEEPDSPRRTRRLEEAIELLWLTDEIRIEPPEPTDEARNVVYYLEGLSAGALPDVLEELRDRLAPLGRRRCRPTYGRSGSAPGSVATATATRTSPRRPPARCSPSRRCTASGSCARSSTGCAATCRSATTSARCPTRSRRGSARSCPGCPRSSRATGGSTPRSPTGCSSPACTYASASPSSASWAAAGTCRAVTTPTTPSSSTTCCSSTARCSPTRAPSSRRARSSGWSGPSPPPA